MWTKKNRPHEQNFGFQDPKWWIWSINGWMDHQQRRIHIFSTFLLGSRGLRLLSTWCLEVIERSRCKARCKVWCKAWKRKWRLTIFGSCDNIEMFFFFFLNCFYRFRFFYTQTSFLRIFLHPCWGCRRAFSAPLQKNFLASAWRWCRSYGHHGIPSMVWLIVWLMGKCWLILIGNPWKPCF